MPQNFCTHRDDQIQLVWQTALRCILYYAILIEKISLSALCTAPVIGNNGNRSK